MDTVPPDNNAHLIICISIMCVSCAIAGSTTTLMWCESGLPRPILDPHFIVSEEILNTQKVVFPLFVSRGQLMELNKLSLYPV